MSTAIITPSVAPEGDGPHRYKWAATDFARAWEQGIFPNDARLELINGEIIEQMRPNPPHVTAVDLVKLALDPIFRPLGAYVRQEHALDLGEHDLPMPDIAVVQGNPRAYATQHPTAEQVLLVCEVADTTLASDRRTKLPLYARAGIPECWILNLPDRRLEVYRDLKEGSYTMSMTLTATHSITPLAAPQSAILIADLLP